MEKQNLGELDLLVETIGRRTGLGVMAVKRVLDGARDLGWELSKRRTHADVHLPQVGGLPRLQDFQMGGK